MCFYLYNSLFAVTNCEFGYTLSRSLSISSQNFSLENLTSDLDYLQEIQKVGLWAVASLP